MELNDSVSRRPDWLSPMNGDLGSTHILTRHGGAQSQIVTWLERSGTMPTSKLAQVSPSGLSKHLRTGVGVSGAPHSYILGGTMGLHYVVRAKQSGTYAT
jgi:hypothetical protein